MIETRPLLSMFLTALLVAAVSACDGFDNPVPWEQSPIADDLVGTWKAVEGQDTGARARVSRAMDDETLGFELTYPEKTESALYPHKYKQRVTFLGNVLGSGSLHVLQVRMDSYDEFDKDGESFWDPATGFMFLRIAPSPENGVHIHRLNGETLGRVAEKALATSGVEIEGEALVRCLSDVSDDLRDSLRAKLNVDPYDELAGIRTCVALRLPSESLEQLSLEHTERVFSGDTTRYVRE